MGLLPVAHPESVNTGGQLCKQLVGCWLGHTTCTGLLPVAHPKSGKIGGQQQWPPKWARFWEPTERHERLVWVHVLINVCICYVFKSANRQTHKHLCNMENIFKRAHSKTGHEGNLYVT